MKNKRKFKINNSLKSIIIGTLSGVFTISLLLLLTSMILTHTLSIPDAVLSTLSMLLASFGTFIGAYISVRIMKSNGLLWGILNGLILFLIVFILGVINHTDLPSIASAIKCMAMVLSGAIGGIISVNKRKKSRY